MALGTLLVTGGLLLQSPRLLSGDAPAQLLLVATAAMLLLQRLRAPASARGQGLWPGVTLTSAAALAAFAAPLAGVLRPVLLHAALALMLLSLIAALLGARMLGRLTVPLAAGLLSIGPGETQLTGTELAWGGLKVSVTSACSGLTLLQNLLWVAWWTVLLRHRGFWPRLGHGLLAVPAVLAANTLRVVALALGAAWYGEQILVGTPHVVIGWLAVALAAGLFLAMEHSVRISAGPRPP
jgi:exosortase/archaeosortase family protein